MKYIVSEVAKLTGVSVRTLHYYDEIGLLVPSEVTDKGVRLYTKDNLFRLQQILFFKELNFTLGEIQGILQDENFDRVSALQKQKRLLYEKRDRLDKIITLLEKTIINDQGGNEMSEQEMFEGFDYEAIKEHEAKYKDEAEQRWGHTDAYKESARRTSTYTQEDWERIHHEQNKVTKMFIDAMPKGAHSEEAMEAVAAWQKQISDAFYPCTNEILAGLGQMYVADERFTKNINKVHEGLAQFESDAIAHYVSQP